MSTARKKEVVKVKSAGKAEKAVSVTAHAILDALPEAVIVYDSNYRITGINTAARMLGLLQGADIRDALTDPAAAQALKDAGAGKSVSLYDATIRDAQAQQITFVPMSQGAVMLSAHLYSRNIHSEWTKKARHALKPAQMMARTLAHEIKNPLTGIQAAAQLLSRLKLEKDDKDLLGLITAETSRILRLVQKVDFFGDNAGVARESVNIHEIISRATGTVRAAHPDVTLIEEFDPSLPDIQGDIDLLTQAVLNVVKNAAEARAKTIRIRTYYDTAAAYHPEHHRKLPLCLSVEDDGTGMDAETLQHMFEPYFTTKPSGEGLGLAIVSKIIDDHGGSIDVDSRAGRTIFKISFPMVKS